ncbi:hypothetical protein GINT2_002342 [Glugoides intestinalis]
MLSKDDNEKDSLNLLIYEYLLKNNFQKTANSFKEEAGITNYSPTDSRPVLATWHSMFLETVDVRSGNKACSDSLNRIEGIMLKLENEKQRYARIRGLSPGRPPAWRPHPSFRPPPFQSDPFSSTSSSPAPLSPHAHAHAPPILAEFKKIDLGLCSLVFSGFCSNNNILIVYCSEMKFYFYNLATNEIEFDFSTAPRCIKTLKIREVAESIYFAYSLDDYGVTLCKYEFGKKTDIKNFVFDSPIKSFCISNDTLYTLNEASVQAHMFLGGSNGISRQIRAQEVESAGSRLLLVDPGRIIEYDFRLGTEVAILAKGRFPRVRIKGSDIFLLLNNAIQVIDATSGEMFSSVKCNLPSVDVALLNNTIAVCTQGDLFYATEIIQQKNPIEMSSYSCFNTTGLIVVSSDGIVSLYNKVTSYD